MISMSDENYRPGWRDTTNARAARTRAKHERWAAELRSAGWTCPEPKATDQRFRIVCQCGAPMDRIETYGGDWIDPDSPLTTRGRWERVDLMCGLGHRGSMTTADHKGDQRFGLSGSAVLVSGDPFSVSADVRK